MAIVQRTKMRMASVTTRMTCRRLRAAHSTLAACAMVPARSTSADVLTSQNGDCDCDCNQLDALGVWW